jgi:hypothetical protein
VTHASDEPQPTDAGDEPARRHVDAVLRRLRQSTFRAKFHLRPADVKLVRDRGLDVIRAHAADLLRTRLAPAEPANDGKQTPWRGHPVFVAQHATATCCRSCLEKWHRIAKGSPLTDVQIAYVIGVIAAWVEHQCELAGDDPRHGDRSTDDAPTLFDL